jgi:cyclophilin family peptidyl-prolyl cis-trans isomerase
VVTLGGGQVTLEDDGRYTAQPTLPFSVYGTVAMARTEDEPDSATSQVRDIEQRTLRGCKRS